MEAVVITTRFGGEVKVLRLATKADVLEMDPPLNDEALINLSGKSWVVVEIDGAGPRIVRVGDLVADEGWCEISIALGKTWECPDCGKKWPRDERCHRAQCEKKRVARVDEWNQRQLAEH